MTKQQQQNICETDRQMNGRMDVFNPGPSVRGTRHALGRAAARGDARVARSPLSAHARPPSPLPPLVDEDEDRRPGLARLPAGHTA